MDCLDPPLAEIPSDVWMCPNHVESFLDSRLNSSRVTERINLWDSFATNDIDTNAVKLQFMKKCSRRKAANKDKATTVASLKRIQVPGYIKAQYNRPPSLLPGPGYDRWVDPIAAGRRMRNRRQLVSTGDPDRQRRQVCDYRLDEEEDADRIGSASSSSRSSNSGGGGRCALEPEKANKDGVGVAEGPVIDDEMCDVRVGEDYQGVPSDLQEDVDKIKSSLKELPQPGICKEGEVEVTPGSSSAAPPQPSSPTTTETSVKDEQKDIPATTKDLIQDTNTTSKNINNESSGTVNTSPAEAEREKTPVQPTREYGKSAIVQKPSAPINLSQSIEDVEPLSNPEPVGYQAASSELYTEEELEWVSSLVSLQTALLRKKLGQDDSLECKEQLPSQDRLQDPSIERSPDSSTLSGISFSGKVAGEQQLMEQLQDYLITHTEVENLDPIVLKYLAAKQIQNILPSRMSLLQSNVRARASLTPVGSKRQPFYMQYRTVDIGTGPEVHLNLRDFGHCNSLSDRHATLFYDELSGHYEVVNYGVAGTTVDECLYAMDVACISNRFKSLKTQQEFNIRRVMAGKAAAVTPCYCVAEPTYDTTQEGFEGSALLHHGSKIKFGCLEFVFAVATEF